MCLSSVGPVVEARQRRVRVIINICCIDGIYLFKLQGLNVSCDAK